MERHSISLDDPNYKFTENIDLDLNEIGKINESFNEKNEKKNNEKKSGKKNGKKKGGKKNDDLENNDILINLDPSGILFYFF